MFLLADMLYFFSMGKMGRGVEIKGGLFSISAGVC